MNQSPTPRTDEALIDNADLLDWGHGKSDLVSANFARQLETELAQWKACAEELANCLKLWHRICNIQPDDDMEALATYNNLKKGEMK